VVEIPRDSHHWGNTGTVESFVPIDIEGLPYKVYNLENLLKGSNAACFAFQFVQLAIPDMLNNVEELVAGILAEVAEAVGQEILALACPQLEAMKLESLKIYLGYMRTANRST
jgi:hypothetical protein